MLPGQKGGFSLTVLVLRSTLSSPMSRFPHSQPFGHFPPSGFRCYRSCRRLEICDRWKYEDGVSHTTLYEELRSSIILRTCKGYIISHALPGQNVLRIVLYADHLMMTMEFLRRFRAQRSASPPSVLGPIKPVSLVPLWRTGGAMMSDGTIA